MPHAWPLRCQSNVQTFYQITFTPSDLIHMTYKTYQWCCGLFRLVTCCARLTFIRRMITCFSRQSLQGPYV